MNRFTVDTQDARRAMPSQTCRNRVHPLVVTALLLVGILFVWIPGQTQIVITRDEIPSAQGVVSEFYVNVGGTVSVDVGQPGGPRTWDFSEGSTADSTVQAIVDRRHTPFGRFFPDANLVYATDNLNIAGIDTAAGFLYMKLDEGSMDMLGAGSEDILGFGGAIVLNPSLMMVTLPLEYGSSWSSSTVFSDIFRVENPSPSPIFPGDSLDVLVEIEFESEGEVDGWGTVVVPYGECEALRVKRHSVTHLQLSVLLGFWYITIFDSTLAIFSYVWQVEELGSVVAVTSRPDEEDPDFSVASTVSRLVRSNAINREVGDVNCDREITPGDALCAFWRSILRHFQPECECTYSEESADVNCDGVITPADALCIFWRSLLGDWTDDCRCPAARVVAQGPKADFVTVESVAGEPGKRVRVPIVVGHPQGLDAFCMRLAYPADLLEFESVSATAATEEWAALDGVDAGSGMVTIGGFHTERITTAGCIAIAEVVFAVREGVTGRGEMDVVDLMDDLSGADVVKGTVVVEATPLTYALLQNSPNPFNVTTTISYALPVIAERELVSGPVHTTLKMYNILGQEVVTLVNETKEAGYHSVQWDGTDGAGQEVPSGVYFYRIEAGTFIETRRMVLLK